MLLYVAGPYTAPTEEGIQTNIDKASDVSAQLWDMGHAVICPHKNTGNFHNVVPHLTHDQWLKGDKQMIAGCDGMVFLPGWENSPGSCEELDYAKSINMSDGTDGKPKNIWFYPDVPPLHPTEVNCPIQVNAFRETLGIMNRIHQDKNADYCVAPDTLVLTTNWEWVAISSLRPGDKIIAFDENHGDVYGKRQFAEAVVESVARVRLPSYKLTLTDGTTLISSAEHAWLASDSNTARWMLTKYLQDAETYTKPSHLIRIFHTWKPDQTRDGGYLAAALDGEGYLTHKQHPSKQKGGWIFRLGFAQKNNAMLAEVERILRSRDIPYKQKFHGATEQLVLVGRQEIVELLGAIRPHRLLPKLLPQLGRVKHYPIVLKSKEFIGDVDLISIQTSTKTYIANGIGSHNSPLNVAVPGEVGLATRLWDKIIRLMNLTGFRILIEMNDDMPLDAQKNWFTKWLWRGLKVFTQRIVVMKRWSTVRSKEAKFESISDTLIDAANYPIIWKLFREGKWGK